MRVALVIVFDPFRDQPEGRFRIGQDGSAGIIALEGFDEGFRERLLSGERTGVKVSARTRAEGWLASEPACQPPKTPLALF